MLFTPHLQNRPWSYPLSSFPLLWPHLKSLLSFAWTVGIKSELCSCGLPTWISLNVWCQTTPATVKCPCCFLFLESSSVWSLQVWLWLLSLSFSGISLEKPFLTIWSEITYSCHPTPNYLCVLLFCSLYITYH